MWPFSGISHIARIKYAFHSSYIQDEQRLRKTGHADDIAILATNSSLLDNSSSLSESLGEALEWGCSEGISFDPGKSELQQFSRLKDKNPCVNLTVRYSSIAVSGKMDFSYTRWPCVYFDKSLSFKWHARILTEKAMKVINALRHLGNTARGT